MNPLQMQSAELERAWSKLREELLAGLRRGLLGAP